MPKGGKQGAKYYTLSLTRSDGMMEQSYGEYPKAMLKLMPYLVCYFMPKYYK